MTERRLTDAAKAAITSRLSGSRGNVAVLAGPGVGDAGALMADFMQAFEAAGWSVGSGQSFGVPGRGFYLRPNSAAGSLAARAVVEAGIPAVVHPEAPKTDQLDPSVPSGPDLMLTIGLA